MHAATVITPDRGQSVWTLPAAERLVGRTVHCRVRAEPIEAQQLSWLAQP